MRRRIICMLLAVCVMISLIPALALPASAAYDMKTSENAIKILKGMEGFIKKPVYDNGQYSVGYGTSCDKNAYPNGITEEEADLLLRKYLAEKEVSVNQFAQRNGVHLSQHQFDALMLFTYNCGVAWMHSEGILRDAIIQGKIGNDFIFPMTLWSSASAKLHMGLVERRLIEANMYLNGKYSQQKPDNYTFVLYDPGEGVCDVKVQGYDHKLAAPVQAVPTRTGYRFLGWYSAKTGGKWITGLTSADAEQVLYAHWQEGNGDAKKGTAAAYTLTADRLDSLDIYDAPNGKVTGKLGQYDAASITADYVDAKNVKWGKTGKGWVRLGDPTVGTHKENTSDKEENGVEVTVTGDFVNVRNGPGTTYKAVSSVKKGDKLIITTTTMVGNRLWGEFRGGWLCLEYTDYKGGVTPEQKPENQPEQEEETPIDSGVVTADRLNIRSAAGTHGYLKGCYQRNDKVKIYEKAVNGNSVWGRTEKGWICLDYVKLDSSTQETTAPTNPAPDENDQQKPTENPGMYGTVTSKNGLFIRSGAGTNFPGVGSYPVNTRIKILEQKLAGGVIWGRTDIGWVCMTYVKLDPVINGDIEGGVSGKVTANVLCIRKGPGTGYASDGSYKKGQIVPILEMTKVGKTTWGRTDKGWVCMDYVKLQDQPAQTPPTTPPATTPTNPPETTAPTEPAQKPEDKPTNPPAQGDAVTGVITANGGLIIREEAGTNSAKVGVYNRGQKVQILAQKMVSGTVWGKTDKGWICMNYVKLETDASGNTTAGYQATVTANALCIRKGPGTGNVIVGSYKKGQIVTILETTKIGITTWGHTDQGWICMDYVK